MVWLIGSQGLLGSRVLELLKEKNIPYLCTNSEVDISNLQSLEDLAKNNPIDWIINCAAYTKVEKAETERARAYEVNALGPKNLGLISSQFGCNVLHISTDYVFDGMTEHPLPEEQPTNPLNWYGSTKLAGEKFLIQETSRAVVLRTAWLYDHRGKNFYTTMTGRFRNGQAVRVVNDQTGCPTWAYELAQASLSIITARKLST